MKDYRYIITLFVSIFFVSHSVAKKPVYPYQNAKLSIEERVQDLLSRMTLQEKVGQLMSPFGWETYEIKDMKKLAKLLQNIFYRRLIRF